MSGSKASVSLVIETLYAVAADPERWEQMVEALGGASGEADPPAAEEGMRHVRAVGLAPAQQASVGVIVVGMGGGVVAANPAGRAVFARRLGAIDARGLKFLDASNHEALSQARRRLKETSGRQVIVKFIQAEDEGPHFAYVTPLEALPAWLSDSLSPPVASGMDGAVAVVFPAAEATDRLWTSVRESFGLTAAETRLAARLKDGLTLKEAADELSVSVNTVRNQLRAIFDKMGLNRQSELVRALTQLSALAGAFDGPARPEPWAPAVLATRRSAIESAPPVQIHRLADGRAFAWRDYGDLDGKPVLCVMQDIGSSLLTPETDRLARELGLRLVTPERAGAGRSDPHPRYGFATAGADYVELARALGLDGVQVAAIADGSPYGMEVARQLGDSASRVLLISGRVPGPQVERAEDRPHLMTLFWRRISRNAWLSDLVFEALRATLNRRQFDRMSRAAASAPADAAYLRAHPEIVDFMFEYTKESLALTARGAADAIRCAARPYHADYSDLAAPVTVWHGAEDSMNSVAEIEAWLGDRLTELRVVPDIGRFLAYRHWTEILAWFAEA
jgi:DNA-binding CsgD family transcriptional regulator/pimeloyl-ACP methyl ester carboxylesterase